MLATDIGSNLEIPDHQPEEDLERQVVTEEQEINVNGVQYIEGKNWTVDYYRQVLTSNDQAHNLDPSLPDGEQQYYKYSDLEIKVTTPINMDSPDNINGAANLLHVIPNIGDVFIVDIAEGKRAMFVITEHTKRTYVSNTIYEIVYHLDTYQVLDPVKFEVLENRVVKEFVYNNVDTLGEKPIITTEEQASIFDAKKTFHNIKRDFIRRFKSEENYLWVTFEDNIYFNYEINNLFGSIAGEYFHLYRNKEVNYITPISLIEERDIHLFNSMESVGYIDNNPYNSNPYAVRLMTVIDRMPNKIIRADGEYTSSYIDTEKYLFSEAFYNGDAVDGIEKLVMDYIEYNALDGDLLFSLVEDYYTMDDMDKYHYGPIIMILLREYWTNV